MKDQKVILEYLEQAIAHTQDSSQAKPHIRRAQRFVKGHDMTSQRVKIAVKSLRRATREELSNGAEAGVYMALDMLEAQQ